MKNSQVGSTLTTHQNTVALNDRDLPVEEIKRSRYRSSNKAFECRFHRIGDGILYLKSFGELKPEYLEKVFPRVKRHLKEKDAGNSSLVWEFTEAKDFRPDAQKIINDQIRELGSYVETATFVPPEKLRHKFKAFLDQGLNNAANAKLALTDNLANAIISVQNSATRSKDVDEDRSPVRASRKQLSKLTKTQLIDLLLDDPPDRDKKMNTDLKGGTERETGLRAMLDELDILVCRVSGRAMIKDFNAAFASEIKKQYQYDPSVGANFLSIFSKQEDKSTWQSRINKALDGKQGVYIDQVLGENEVIVYEVKTCPVKRNKKVNEVAIFITDITSLQKSELRLVEKNRDLDRINKELDNFVYRVSHDLRAPITSIMGLINLIKLEDDQEKLRNYFDLQEKSVQKLDFFIKDIINLSRNTRLGITVEKIDFDELLGNLFQQFDQKPLGAKIEKKLFFNENVPLYTDRSRLSTILSHLISNGIKFYNSHQAKPFVHIYVTCNENDASIEVKDNGIGIAPEYLSKIYTMFFRAAKEDPGSGLGLYIVKETVNKLNGEIVARSKLREGTSFTLKIPNLISRFKAAAKMR